MKNLLKNSRLLYFVLGALIIYGIMSARVEKIRQETLDAVIYYPAIFNYSEKPDAEDGYVHSFSEGSIVRYDLDHDGYGEDISFDVIFSGRGFLTIDNSTVEVQCFTPTGYFNVVHADVTRGVMLVAVSDYGPSDDFQTVFYSYDGNCIKEVGYINDVIGQNVYGYPGATCHGNGTITAKNRWDVLGTWNTVGTYRVSESGVEDITDFYPFVDWDGNLSTWEVRAKVDIVTYGNTMDPSMQTVQTVPAGTRMRMTGLQTTPLEGSFWVAFDVGKMGTRWIPVERMDWVCYVHTGIGFVNSEQAFDGFYYAG